MTSEMQFMHSCIEIGWTAMAVVLLKMSSDDNLKSNSKHADWRYGVAVRIGRRKTEQTTGIRRRTRRMSACPAPQQVSPQHTSLAAADACWDRPVADLSTHQCRREAEDVFVHAECAMLLRLGQEHCAERDSRLPSPQ